MIAYSDPRVRKLQRFMQTVHVVLDYSRLGGDHHRNSWQRTLRLPGLPAEVQVPFLWTPYKHAVGITTGGFLYTGTIYLPQIYLSQYIAPLMSDFNPSLTTSGRVLVHSTDEKFTIQWD